MASSESEIRKRIKEIEDDDIMVVVTGLGGFMMDLPFLLIDVFVTKGEDTSVALVYVNNFLYPSEVSNDLKVFDKDIDMLSDFPALWFENPQEGIAAAQIIQRAALKEKWNAEIKVTEE